MRAANKVKTDQISQEAHEEMDSPENQAKDRKDQDANAVFEQLGLHHHLFACNTDHQVFRPENHAQKAQA